MNHMDQARAHYSEGVPTEIDPVTTTIDHLLFSAAQDYPERVAVDFLGREYSYAEILDEVRRAAQVLKMVGVRRGDVISLIMPNCPQHYVAFYAAMSL